jgi:rhodanese-related sulfurtransferase
MFKMISAEAARSLIHGRHPVIFDVRDSNAYANARIPNAIHLTFPTVKSTLKTLRRDHPVLIYCYRGHASRDFAQMLTDFKFEEVYSMDGGFEAWSAVGAEVERPPVGRAEIRSDPLLDWLLDQGGDPDEVNAPLRDGAYPLIKACRLGLAAIAEALVEAGAPLDRIDEYGNDALWAACYSGDLRTIAVLLDAGIDLDRQNPNGATALIYAASAGKTEVVAFLLEAGANPNLKTQDDFTALELSANPAILKLLKPARKATG